MPRAGRSRPPSRMMPSPSRSHWIAAPVTKIAPSIAYVTVAGRERPRDGREQAVDRLGQRRRRRS